MKRMLAAVLVAGGFVTAAQAADIAPMQAHITRFGSDTSVLVYFVPAHDGFHVVATAQNGSGEDVKVARFVTVLASGQHGSISVPGVSNETATLVFSRVGGRLRIDEPLQVASAR